MKAQIEALHCCPRKEILCVIFLKNPKIVGTHGLLFYENCQILIEYVDVDSGMTHDISNVT